MKPFNSPRPLTLPHLKILAALGYLLHDVFDPLHSSNCTLFLDGSAELDDSAFTIRFLGALFGFGTTSGSAEV
jgi:hypothetical protein